MIYQANHYYRTRDGQIAFITSIGAPLGLLHGRIHGSYSHTWWKPDGAHNLFPSDDLMEEVEEEAPFNLPDVGEDINGNCAACHHYPCQCDDIQAREEEAAAAME